MVLSRKKISLSFRVALNRPTTIWRSERQHPVTETRAASVSAPLLDGNELRPVLHLHARATSRYLTTSAPRRGLAHRRTQDVWREEILSRQPASEDRPAHLRNHHQGALGLRAGSPANERRTWS